MTGTCPKCEREFTKQRSKIVFCSALCHHQWAAIQRRASAKAPAAVEGARWIALTKGKFCLVDDVDYDWLTEKAHWCFSQTGSDGGYAVACVAQVKVYMHALILNADSNEVDHRNRDRLDNRRSNLRVATHQSNAANSVKPKRGGGNATEYRGVHATKTDGRFVAMIAGTYIAGSYGTAEDAALAYDKAAKDRYGSFATINFGEK